jgi:alpha/beta superfamily hydrolase
MELFIPGPAGKLEAVDWMPQNRGEASAVPRDRAEPRGMPHERVDALGTPRELIESQGLPQMRTQPRGAAVMCHPHPLYGGTMNSSVVFRAARGLQLAGLEVLRFNFRGVGQSEGVHDGRVGEHDDLRAAIDWLAARNAERELWAGGFSFGSRVAASVAATDDRVRRVVLVALPVKAFDCSFIRDVKKPGLIVMAERDEYGTKGELLRRHPDLHPALEVVEIAGTGHFFEGATHALQEVVHAWAERTLESKS